MIYDPNKNATTHLFVKSNIAPASGGPTSDPTPCTSRINPYANVKSSISTNRLVMIGVNENELANVTPNIAHRMTSHV